MIAGSGACASACHTSGSLCLPDSTPKISAICVRRQGVGEQVLGLAGVAEQVGSNGEVGHEFVDQPIESCRGDHPKPGGGARESLQIRFVKLLEEPSRGRLAHHQENGRGLFRPAQRPFAADRRLRHGCCPAPL